MTLDDIEKSIYGGKKGIDEALNSINHYLSNKKQMMDPQKYIDIQTALKLVNGQYSAISTQFINHISINNRYKSYIKDSIPEIRDFDTRAIAIKIIDVATEDANKRILNAKESDTKRNRQFEKAEIVKFFNMYFTSLVNLLELYRLFLNMKNIINR